MANYRFSLRKADGSAASTLSVICPNVASAWSVVGDLARGNGAQACGSILVTGERDEVVILVGVASARALTGRRQENHVA